MQARPNEAFLVRGDVRSAAACTALVQGAHHALGGLDVLINNAGGVVERRLRHRPSHRVNGGLQMP